MTLKELEDKWYYRQLSVLGKELWESFDDGHWYYPRDQNSGWVEDVVRTHVEHGKTKIRIAFNFKNNLMNLYGEHGPSWGFVLLPHEQKILLRRFRECVNKQIAFQFQIAPFKENL